MWQTMGQCASCTAVDPGDDEAPAGTGVGSSATLALHKNFVGKAWLKQGDYKKLYGVDRRLGKGAYGTVYKASALAARTAENGISPPIPTLPHTHTLLTLTGVSNAKGGRVPAD